MLRKIHRWIGLLSALWLLQLAVTGLLLQHADDLNLTHTHVSSPTILKWFGYGTRQQVWQSQGAMLYQIDDVIGYKDQQINLSGELVGATMWSDNNGVEYWVVATRDSLYMLNHQGEVAQHLDDFDGLPTPVNALNTYQGQIQVESINRWFRLEDSGEFTSTTVKLEDQNQSRGMTTAEQNQYYAKALQDKLSYDKVLHGIHAGIQGSKWLNSLSALALFYLCFSGIYLFFKQPKRKR